MKKGKYEHKEHKNYYFSLFYSHVLTRMILSIVGHTHSIAYSVLVTESREYLQKIWSCNMSENNFLLFLEFVILRQCIRCWCTNLLKKYPPNKKLFCSVLRNTLNKQAMLSKFKFKLSGDAEIFYPKIQYDR